MTLPRRIYRRELREALGYGETWFSSLQKKGRIPRGHRDHPNGREWYTEAEAFKIIEAQNSAAAAAPA